MSRTFLILVSSLVLAAAFVGPPATANETDQFLLPDRDSFVDLGPYLSTVHHGVFEKIVAELNAEIERAVRRGDEDEIRRLHDPMLLANKVRAAFGPGFFETLGVEDVLRSGLARKAAPGRILAYKTSDWIYNFAHLPIDPRNLPLLVQSSTLKANGVYLGTDKLGHFHDLGHIYYKDYLAKRERGASHEDAVATIVERFSRGLISENAVIGRLATGVVSNADLASNYLGFKFYRNLTEPVMLKGEERPPMFVRVGPYWRLNHHVRPENNFFAWFVSDHWNEALNPCDYEAGLRNTVRRRVEENAAQIVAFYADENGEPRPREWFEQKARELTTYYGEDYGHTGLKDNMITIARVCYGPDGSLPPGVVAATTLEEQREREARSDRN